MGELLGAAVAWGTAARFRISTIAGSSALILILISFLVLEGSANDMKAKVAKSAMPTRNLNREMRPYVRPFPVLHSSSEPRRLLTIAEIVLRPKNKDVIKASQERKRNARKYFGVLGSLSTKAAPSAKTPEARVMSCFINSRAASSAFGLSGSGRVSALQPIREHLPNTVDDTSHGPCPSQTTE